MTPEEFNQWCRNWHRQQAPFPLVMGVLNCTPDSFSDGGVYCDALEASRRAEQMLTEGADILDIGGESSRPGARPVGTDEESARILPVIKAIRRRGDTMISVDTCKPDVMREALDAGAGMINDINALQAKGALECVAQRDVPVCLMHMQGTPQNMQQEPCYPSGVISCLQDFFKSRYNDCRQAGIAAEKIIFDPGFGFGKQLEHNLAILKDMAEITKLANPVLLGVSRKTTLGIITGTSVDNRVAAGLAVAVHAVLQGVAIIRTHDVAATRQALQMINAINNTVEVPIPPLSPKAGSRDSADLDKAHGFSGQCVETGEWGEHSAEKFNDEEA